MKKELNFRLKRQKKKPINLRNSSGAAPSIDGKSQSEATCSVAMDVRLSVDKFTNWKQRILMFHLQPRLTNYVSKNYGSAVIFISPTHQHTYSHSLFLLACLCAWLSSVPVSLCLCACLPVLSKTLGIINTVGQRLRQSLKWALDADTILLSNV